MLQIMLLLKNDHLIEENKNNNNNNNKNRILSLCRVLQEKINF